MGDFLLNATATAWRASVLCQRDGRHARVTMVVISHKNFIYFFIDCRTYNFQTLWWFVVYCHTLLITLCCVKFIMLL